MTRRGRLPGLGRPAPARAPCGMPCARKPDRPCRAGRRTQRCPPLPTAGSFEIRRPACRQGAAGRAPRDHPAAQPKGGRGAKTDGQTHSACGGAAKGGMGASAAARRLVRRIRQPWTGSWDGNRARAAAPAGMPKGARRAGSKAARRRGVTPNGPAGLRSGQRQRRAGNPIFGPIAFIALNACMRSTFALAFGNLGYF